MKKFVTIAISLGLLSTISPFMPVVAHASRITESSAPSGTTGTLRALMATEASGSASPLQDYVVDTPDGNVVVPEDSVVSSSPGADVVFDGRTVRDVSPDAGAVHTSGLSAAAGPISSGYAPIAQRNLVVVPLVWAGSTFGNDRSTQLNTVLPALDAWWSNTSGGVEDLTIRTLPVTTITAPADCDQGVYDMESATKSAVAAAGLGTWATNVAAVLPTGPTSTCWWGGLGYMPGRFVWINQISTKVFQHELGHNMGLAHANSCMATFTVSLLGKCKHVEYGDWIDPMGMGKDNAVYGPSYLQQIGWLPPSQWASWTGTPATYTMSPVDSSNGGTRGVRIDARGSLLADAPGEYWLQYRVSTDPSTSTGVYLTLTPTPEHVARGVDKPELARTGTGLFTWLCDITPSGIGFDRSAALQLGVPWSDPLGRFSITVNSMGAYASVTVRPTGKSPAALTTSTAAPVLDAAGQATGSVRINWTATVPVYTEKLGEPVIIDARIAGTDVGCSAAVFAGSCVISRIPRNRENTVIITPRNYAGDGPSVSTGIGIIPDTLASGTLTVGIVDTSAQIELTNLDDGGSTISALSDVTDDRGGKCVLINGRCAISGLLANTRYVYSLDITNARGTRTVRTEVTTPVRAPSTPNYFVTKTADAFRVFASPHQIDVNNVSRIGYGCGWQADPTVPVNWAPWTPSASTVQFDLPLGTTDLSCFIVTDNKVGRASIQILLARKAPAKVDPAGGGTYIPQVTLTVRRSKNRRNLTVTWKAVDANGFDVTDDFPPASMKVSGIRKCVWSLPRGCRASGLRPLKSYTVSVQLSGLDTARAISR